MIAPRLYRSGRQPWRLGQAASTTIITRAAGHRLSGECSAPCPFFHCCSDWCWGYACVAVIRRRGKGDAERSSPVAALAICLYEEIGPSWPGVSAKYGRSSINACSSASSTRLLQLLLSWRSLSLWHAISPQRGAAWQFAVKQEQMAQNIATLQAATQDIKQKIVVPAFVPDDLRRTAQTAEAPRALIARAVAAGSAAARGPVTLAIALTLDTQRADSSRNTFVFFRSRVSKSFSERKSAHLSTPGEPHAPI